MPSWSALALNDLAHVDASLTAIQHSLDLARPTIDAVRATAKDLGIADTITHATAAHQALANAVEAINTAATECAQAVTEIRSIGAGG